MAGATQNCCHPLHVLCTPTQPCIISHHFMQSDIRRVHVCLAVTCHLHFWQNDWDFFCASVVTWVWHIYQNKSQHRKLTLEKKKKENSPQLLLGLEPTTFWSQVQRSNYWAIPIPQLYWSLYAFSRLLWSSCMLSLLPTPVHQCYQLSWLSQSTLGMWSTASEGLEKQVTHHWPAQWVNTQLGSSGWQWCVQLNGVSLSAFLSCEHHCSL